MFGLIVAGRSVITSFQAISPTQFTFSVPSQPSFSHIVVFLLPGNSLPLDTAAAVYIQFPPSAEFKLLGAISNEKQSAIYKTNGIPATEQTLATGQDDDLMVDDVASQALGDVQALGGVDIILGISVEPVANVAAQLATLKTNVTAAPLQLSQPQQQAIPTKTLAQRIIKNAFNYLSSFAGGSGANETIPLKSFQDWWIKFENRIDADPGFLERDQD